MKPCNFLEKYANDENKIDKNTPELRLMEQLCAGEKSLAGVFFEEKMTYGMTSYIDAPHGRFEGFLRMNEFCDGWLKSFKAISAESIPVIQTISGLRSASEIVVRFALDNGETQEIPMMVVGDLRAGGKLDAVRIYFWWNWVEGFSPVRSPAFTPTHTTPGELNLLTGYFREYYANLHNPNSEEALEHIMNTFEPDFIFGGYAPAGQVRSEGEVSLSPLEAHRIIFRDKILYNTPSWRGVRFETLIDDGRTVVMEWVLTLNPIGYEHGSVSQSGVAAYERGATGKLKSIRICDNLSPDDERQIDHSKAYENFFTAYPNIGYGWLKP